MIPDGNLQFGEPALHPAADGPGDSSVFTHLRLSVPVRMVLGMLWAAVGFGVLVLACMLQGKDKANMGWLIGAYFAITVGGCSSRRCPCRSSQNRAAAFLDGGGPLLPVHRGEASSPAAWAYWEKFRMGTSSVAWSSSPGRRRRRGLLLGLPAPGDQRGNGARAQAERGSPAVARAGSVQVAPALAA